MKKVLLVIIVTNLAFLPTAWSWNDKVTHKTITDVAAEQSDLSTVGKDVLRRLDFEDGLNEVIEWPEHLCGEEKEDSRCTVRDWLRYGSVKEDAKRYIPPPFTTRSFNHFHEPIQLTIDGPGLHDMGFSGQSNLEWAQDTDQQTADPLEGDQSWSELRRNFYLALTIDNKSVREETFAELFKGLGHQMHLLQDMGVPYHVRNDAHPLDALQGRGLFPSDLLFFETWAMKNDSKIKDFGLSTKATDLPQTTLFDRYYGGDLPYGVAKCPVSQLWDANRYDGTNPSVTNAQGLSEYTNANFYSGDTVFAAERYSDGHPHYYPYPKQESTDMEVYFNAGMIPEVVVAEDGRQDFELYLSKVADGESVDDFVRVGYFAREAIPNENLYLFSRSSYLDEACHEDYAEKLVPKSVGYSAALLNYFFRGELELIPSEENGAAGYKIKNNTEEDMEGTFKVFYDKKEGDEVIRVQLWSGWLHLMEKSSGNNESDHFVFDQQPEYDIAEEIGKYIVVFSGRLGKEHDAVAGSVSNLNEGEYVYVNLGDRALVWDIAKNKFAEIYDDQGNPIDFPCDSAALSDWRTDHPRVSPAEIEWDYQPFVNDNPPTDQCNPEPGRNCDGPFVNNQLSYKTPCEVNVCYPTPGLPGRENCFTAYKDAQSCGVGSGPYQHCHPNSDNPTWYDDEWTRNERTTSTTHAFVPESTGANAYRWSMFGSYTGRYNGYEGNITTQIDDQTSLDKKGRSRATFHCDTMDYTYDIEIDADTNEYHSYKFHTFLGELGEIALRNQIVTHTEEGQNSQAVVYDVKRIDTTPVNDWYRVDRFKKGLITHRSIVFVFLYQYRLQYVHYSGPFQAPSFSYSAPELFVQAAAKNVDDSSKIDPFSISRSASFSNALKILVADFYTGSGAQETDILQIDNRVTVEIRSQIN